MLWILTVHKKKNMKKILLLDAFPSTLKKRKIYTSCHIVSDLYPKMLTGADRILLQFIKGLTQSVFGDWL